MWPSRGPVRSPCTSSTYCKSSSRDLGTFRTPFIGLIIRVVRRGLISKATTMVARERVLLAMRGVNTVLSWLETKKPPRGLWAGARRGSFSFRRLEFKRCRKWTNACKRKSCPEFRFFMTRLFDAAKKDGGSSGLGTAKLVALAKKCLERTMPKFTLKSWRRRN